MLIKICFVGVYCFYPLAENLIPTVIGSKPILRKTKLSSYVLHTDIVLFLWFRSEHVKRYPNCGFLTMKKDFTELTVGEFYLMEQERLKVYHVSIPIICVKCVQ